MRRGCHLITGEIIRRLPNPPIRFAEYFCEAYILRTHNKRECRPDVRSDMDKILDHVTLKEIDQPLAASYM